MKNVNYVTVMYNGEVVGYLKEIENERIAFQYDEEWINTGFSISPFSLPLSNKIYISKYDPFNGIYGVFYDSLPDGWGEYLVNKMLVKNGINPIKVSQLTRLTLVDKEGLGGLNYVPSSSKDVSLEGKNYDDLYTLCKEILEDKENINFDRIFQHGGSSGGTRPKVNVKINNESWIVKFPSRYDSKNIGLEEYKANDIARQCGIDVAEFKLFHSNLTSGYFATKRFDRIGNKRIHTISLSSLLETTYDIPNLDYMYLFQVINRISANKEYDLYQAFKRMCFNVFSYNKDDHGKNFSFIYDEKFKGYVLSPAYDLTILKNKTEHEMTINGNGNPSISDLLFVAQSFKLSEKKCLEIINDIKNKCKDI